MYGYIYRITDLTNGKCYIGQHKYDKPMLDPTYHGSGKLIKPIYEKRPNTLLEEILMICATLDELNYFETYFIEHLNTLDPNGYNLTKGGDDNPMNNPIVAENHKKIMRSEEVRRKISENLPDLSGERNGMYGKGYLIEGEKNGMYGKTHTDEYKQILHDKMSGEGNPQYGKKGELATCYGRCGELHPFYNQHHSEAAKKQISETLKDHYNKPENQKVCRCLLYIYTIMFHYKQKEISNILNIPIGTIQKYLKKYNIKFDNKSKKVIQYSLEGELINEYDSAAEAARQTGVNVTGIQHCCNGLQGTSHGYIWKYKK